MHNNISKKKLWKYNFDFFLWIFNKKNRWTMGILEVFGNSLKTFLILDYETYRNIMGVFSYVWKMAPVGQFFQIGPT